MPLVSKQQKLPGLLNQLNLVSIGFMALFIVYLGIGQAWRLQPPDIIRNQWIAVTITTFIFLLILGLSQKRKASTGYYYLLVFSQITTYLGFISYVIYAQRGMASAAVILYTIPVLVAAVTKASWAVISTAFLAGTSYCLAAFKYFSDYPSEGYKAELYGQMIFYFCVLLLLSRLVHVLLSEKS